MMSRREKERERRIGMREEKDRWERERRRDAERATAVDSEGHPTRSTIDEERRLHREGLQKGGSGYDSHFHKSHVVTPGNSLGTTAGDAFIEYNDPKTEDMRRIAYECCVLDPAHAEPMTGVYTEDIAQAPLSVKLRIRSQGTLIATESSDGTGHVLCSFLDSTGLQTLGGPPTVSESDGMSDYYTAAYADNRLPKTLPIDASHTAPWYSPPKMSFPSTFTNMEIPVIPAYKEILGSATTQGVACAWPADLGINIDGAFARLVGMEARIYCTQNNLTKNGTGMIFRPQVPFDGSLYGKTATELFDDQQIECTLAPLNEIGMGQYFKVTRIPTGVEAKNWLPIDWQDAANTVMDIDVDIMGGLWGGFAAYGCEVGETFLVVMDTILEVRDNSFSFGTPNAPVNGSAKAAESLHQATPPTVLTTGDRTVHDAAAVAQAEVGEMGKKHAKGFLDYVGDVPGHLGEVADVASSLTDGAEAASSVASAGDIIGDILGGLAIFGLAKKQPKTLGFNSPDRISYHPATRVKDFVFRAPVTPPTFKRLEPPPDCPCSPRSPRGKDRCAEKGHSWDCKVCTQKKIPALSSTPTAK
jgi:hypothetical protein